LSAEGRALGRDWRKSALRKMIKEVFGKKLGMTQIFTEDGHLRGVTLIEVYPCRVLQETDCPGKKKVLIGCQEVKKEAGKKRPQLGYFKKTNQPYFRYLKETEKLKEEPFKIGDDLGIEIFLENEKIDITGPSIGRGFQGGMKRHNWSGQPKSHGSTTHRRVGSVGASAYPSKIVKGHRMPGHLGNSTVTIKNLKIIKIDKQKSLLFVQGSCPGPRNSLVIIKKRAS
jgi:large subunit ribosomal protein L3